VCNVDGEGKAPKPEALRQAATLRFKGLEGDVALLVVEEFPRPKKSP
jgi:hypothetical protein